MLSRSSLDSAVRDLSGGKAHVVGAYRMDGLNGAYRVEAEVEGLFGAKQATYYAKEGDLAGDALGVELAGYAGLPTYRVEQYDGFALMEAASGSPVSSSKGAIGRDPKRFAYELGRIAAYDYVFGVGDGHAGNVLYDGRRATRIDLESVLRTDLVDARYSAHDLSDNLEGFEGLARELEPYLLKGFKDAYSSIRSHQDEALGSVRRAVSDGLEAGDGYAKRRVDEGAVREVSRRIGEDPEGVFGEVFGQYLALLERKRS